MARFHRDNDLAHFDAQSDVTAAEARLLHFTSGKAPAVTTDVQKEAAALESLRKRMAGPSSAKAGLALDQGEINRKIYEASKGSKYFDNERRNDERTTEAIEKMLRKRDEVLAITPEGSTAWKTIERKIDEKAIQLETSRDLSRAILHADMDMFYAAVELKRDPTLKGKAFGVGSGVLVTASYEARQFGVRSGMASHIALSLCPHLTIVKNDMESYKAASEKVMDIFQEYDPDYAQMSLDEAYLDVTTYCQMNQMDVEDVVRQLRNEVETSTGLTVSVGIAPNKMLAKISSDRNKPNGQFRVQPERNFIINLMQDLPCRKVPGIGRVTERILSSLGVNNCGDIWTHRVLLQLVWGDIDWLLNSYLGIHSNIVEPAKRGERRSVGREHTFRPTSDVKELKELLQQSAVQVGKDLKRLDYRGKTVTLTFKTDQFRRYTRAKTLPAYQYLSEDLYTITCKLLDAEIVQRGGPFALRLIGVRVSSLRDMKEPEKGGLKRMLEQARTSPQKRSKEKRPTRQHSDELSAVSAEDDEDNEVLCAVQASQQEFEGLPAEARANLDAKFQCPVCEQSFTFGGDAQQRNAMINQHVDQCLSRQTSLSSNYRQDKKKRSAGPLDSFLRKAP